MFGYETLEDIRNLEMFLGFEPSCNTGCCSKTSLKETEMKSRRHNSEIEEKSNLVKDIKDYFTGNSNVWYTYKYNEDTNDIEYKVPRTFSKDLNNLKNYLVGLIKRN